MGNPVRPERRASDETETERANRGEWDRYADEYQQTHGRFLGDAGFVWSPEGTEEGDLACSATWRTGQCSRSAAAPASAPAGCSRRVDTRSGWTCRTASSSTAGGSMTSWAPGSRW